MQRALRDCDTQKAQLLKNGKVERAGVVPIRENTAAEAGDAKRRADAGRGEGGRSKPRWNSSSWRLLRAGDWSQASRVAEQSSSQPSST
jgi:hypothetical protein